jgi:hypothetical protein
MLTICCMLALTLLTACKSSTAPRADTSPIWPQETTPPGVVQPAQFDFENPSELVRMALSHLDAANRQIRRTLTSPPLPIFHPTNVNLLDLHYLPDGTSADINFFSSPTGRSESGTDLASYPILNLEVERSGKLHRASAGIMWSAPPPPAAEVPIPAAHFNEPAWLVQRALDFYYGPEVPPKGKQKLNREDLQLCTIRYSMKLDEATVFFDCLPNKITGKTNTYNFDSISIKIGSSGDFRGVSGGTSYETVLPHDLQPD